MKKNLLIICKAQFGYLTDYYKYCEYLRDEWVITYLCFDSGLKKLLMEQVNTLYISNKGIKLIRGIRFILSTIRLVFHFEGLVMVNYFEKCTLIKRILPWKKMILDIRTLSVNPNKNVRRLYDKKIKKASNIFDFTTVISEGVREKIGINKCNSAILPLGSDIISKKNKNFENNIRLLYVGTLNGRNIHHTVIGLSLLLEKYQSKIPISYNIIGDGFEMEKIKNIVKNKGLQDIVKIYGRIPHFELAPFFDECNVGISYLPKTEYYNVQPLTKTFEYIQSGMCCIATNTDENKKIICSENGVLCEDNPDSFTSALFYIINNIKNFDSTLIRKTAEEFTWERIVRKELLPILEELY